MKNKLYVVLVENSNTDCYDILGGVFDNKKDLKKFIKDADLEDQGYEVEEVIINKANYMLIS